MSESTNAGPIAYLINQYPKVSHSFIRREILALERRGLEVHRFAMRGWDGPLADEEDLSERGKTRYLLQKGAISLLGPTVRICLGAPGRFLSALRLALRSGRRADRSLAYHVVYLAEACCLLEWLRRSQVTHLHAHFGTNGAQVAMLVRELGGPPFSFTVHGPDEFDKPVFLGLREKIDRAKFVVAISSFGRSQLYRWASAAAWHKVQVVHCGLEPGFIDANDLEAEPPAAPLRLVCVGRLSEQKGQLLLLEAVHRLACRGVALELVLAGDGEMRDELETKIQALRLGQGVRITGWISGAQVRAEIFAARALVLASFAEGLPVVLMEAMALGRPVISTFVAGIPELVEDGKTGWLVPAGDIDALTAALQSCLAATPEQLSQMGHRGKARALARHNIDDSAAQLAALFQLPVPEPA